MNLSKIKMVKIGGSNYLIVPSEFIKVYGLDKNFFEITATSNKITYTINGDKEELLEEE